MISGTTSEKRSVARTRSPSPVPAPPAAGQIKTPGLVVLSELDPFVKADRWEVSARNAGAKVARLEGLGHWWPLQDPARGDRMLREFWDSLGSA